MDMSPSMNSDEEASRVKSGRVLYRRSKNLIKLTAFSWRARLEGSCK